MKFFLVLFLLTFTQALHSATYKIFAAETPPFLEKSGEGVEGFTGTFGSIVAEKIKKSGKTSEFEVTWVPWKRALSETAKVKNAIFFPLARSKDRENKFVWLGRLGAVESWFYTTDPKIKIKTLDDIKKYRIGFMSGSNREEELIKIFGSKNQNLEGLTADVDNLKKLIFGRIHIWVTQTQVFEESLKDYKAKHPNAPKIYAVRKFIDQDIWVAGVPDMDKKYQEKLQVIFK